MSLFKKAMPFSVLALVLLLIQQPGNAQSSPPNALPFFKNYSSRVITGSGVSTCPIRSATS